MEKVTTVNNLCCGWYLCSGIPNSSKYHRLEEKVDSFFGVPKTTNSLFVHRVKHRHEYLWWLDLSAPVVFHLRQHAIYAGYCFI